MPNSLPMECSRCKVASTCPRAGSSPLVYGTRKSVCHLVGGYGRVPIDPSVLSPESAGRSKEDGPCLTVAHVPVILDGVVTVDVVTVFNHPVLHERETIGPGRPI